MRTIRNKYIINHASIINDFPPAYTYDSLSQIVGIRVVFIEKPRDLVADGSRFRDIARAREIHGWSFGQLNARLHGVRVIANDRFGAVKTQAVRTITAAPIFARCARSLSLLPIWRPPRVQLRKKLRTLSLRGALSQVYTAVVRGFAAPRVHPAVLIIARVHNEPLCQEDTSRARCPLGSIRLRRNAVHAVEER